MLRRLVLDLRSPSPSPRKGLVAALVLSLVVLLSWRARAQSIIPPGRDAEVLSLVRAALASEADAPEFDVSIEQDRLRISLQTTPPVQLLVFESGPTTEPRLAPGVTLRCGGSCDESQRRRWRPLARRLARERDRLASKIWSAPVRPPAESSQVAISEVKPRAAHLLFALGFSWLLGHGLRRRPRAVELEGDFWLEPRRALGGLSGRAGLEILALVGFALAALQLTAAMPLHEHNSYVARADCAYSGLCDRDPAGPGWSSAFFHGYFWPLRLAGPYSVASACRVSLLFSLAAAFLAGVLSRRLGQLAGMKRAQAEWLGFTSVMLFLANPILMRVAVAGTPWPYVTTCLLGAALATLSALESPRPLGRWLAGAAACALFCLATNSNAVMLVLAPLAYLAPLCWSTTEPKVGLRRWLPTRDHLCALIVCVAWLVPPVLETAAILAEKGPGRTMSLTVPPSMDLRLVPVGFALATLIGIGLAFLRRRTLLIVVLPMLALQPTLGGYAGLTLGPSYPVGMVNAWLLLVPATLLAALGLNWALFRSPGWWKWGLVLATFLLPLPLLSETRDFAFGERVLERELHAISAVLPGLPEHQRLLVPSGIQDKLDARLPWTGDPIGAFFPEGEYHAVRRRQGLKPARIEYIGAVADPGARGTLVYVGSPLRSFHRAEVEKGLVGPELARPELANLRANYTLTPVRVFRVRTEQSPHVAVRLGGDTVDSVELGFYRARRKQRRP